jgi:L-ascorbate metabolism protein UlaG (beta-lactamase superfamily)
MRHIHLKPSARIDLLKDEARTNEGHTSLLPTATQAHPKGTSSQENASLFFIGTATTILEWQGIRIMTDPNFLHAGDHVHLGPGVSATRRTNPALNLDELPRIDCILLSHYHEDHFDRLVEDSLNRDFPILTTPHARQCLTSTSQTEPFRAITSIDFFESVLLEVDHPPGSMQKQAAIKVTGMPGKHVPPGPLSVANDILKAVPPTNGWLLELGYAPLGLQIVDDEGSLSVGYRIYITGDTLFVDELKNIPKFLNDQKLDLMLIHLGGRTIPGPSLPLLMVTMDDKQGLQLMQLMNPDVTIPIHYDDYDVFTSPLDDFKQAVADAGLKNAVVYLDRGEAYSFTVKST